MIFICIHGLSNPVSPLFFSLLYVSQTLEQQLSAAHSQIDAKKKSSFPSWLTGTKK
jgi:hypothetical protein